ncbi:class I SAM-dependent methyltransferase [Patulibacter sp. NPDC049589]|uniref:class I SAM-dependent methyltransferase n=1 Tax=Patulibacter sp. NPDC049589 TaxID=3154731 RepID=UPI003415B54C
MADVADEVDANFPYGLDRPKQARGTAGLGMLFGVLTLGSALLPNAFESGLIVLVLALLTTCITSFFVSAGLFRTGSTKKIQAADRMLNGLELRGDEDALDLGCGTGLLCAGLAVRLPKGKVTGVDAWVQSQLTPNGRTVAKRTLSLAGVKGVTLRTGSIRELPVQDAGFDLVVSRDCLALLPSDAARGEAVAELARALRPGGRVALLEPFCSRGLVKHLRAAGLADAERSKAWRSVMPWARLVTASKPAAS